METWGLAISFATSQPGNSLVFFQLQTFYSQSNNVIFLG